MFILKCENDSNFPDVNSSSSILQYTLTTFGMVSMLSILNLLVKDLEFFKPNYLKIIEEDEESENHSMEDQKILEAGLINNVNISPKKVKPGDKIFSVI